MRDRAVWELVEDYLWSPVPLREHKDPEWAGFEYTIEVGVSLPDESYPEGDVILLEVWREPGVGRYTPKPEATINLTYCEAKRLAALILEKVP